MKPHQEHIDGDSMSNHTFRLGFHSRLSGVRTGFLPTELKTDSQSSPGWADSGLCVERIYEKKRDVAEDPIKEKSGRRMQG